MKKNSATKSDLQKRLALRKWEHELERKKHLKNVRRSNEHRASHAPTLPLLKKKKGTRGKRRYDKSIRLPEDFRLSENYSAVVGAIASIKKKFLIQKNQFVDFNQVRRIGTKAAIMLAAEFDICRIKSPGIRHRSHDNRWNAEIREILDDLGLFDLLGIKRQSKPLDDRVSPVTFIKFFSEMDARMNEYLPFRSKIDEQIAKHAAEPIKGEAKMWLYMGLSEAAVNAIHHAYLKPGKLSRWWVSASYHKDDGDLRIVCYDRGLTIPKTLPRAKIWERVRNLTGKIGLDMGVDADLIYAAIESRRTATKQSHRGRGLIRLISFIDACGNGRLSIYSRRGLVHYHCENGKMRHERETLKKAFPGTLIEWRIIKSHSQESLP